MFSFWEQQSLLRYDYVVIGAGTVGLHTAIVLRERYPSASIVVVERSVLPYGASTRNAGFACIGSLTELISDLEQMSVAEMAGLVARRKKGLERLRRRLGDEAIGYRQAGSHELLEAKDLPALARLDELNHMLSDINDGQAVFSLANEKINDFGFPINKVKALVANHAEGELHTGKMMWALKEYAVRQGIELKTGAEVVDIDRQQAEPLVWIKDRFREELVPLRCRQLFVCTNAFTNNLLPGYDLQPGRGQVLLTDPIPKLRLKGIFHFDEGYYYFRELQGRILFGGGRNLDKAGETTDQLELHKHIQAQLDHYLQQLILPGQKPRIAMRWSGIMAFGQTKQPILTQAGAQVFAAFRMGGMGVALAAQVAEDLVTMASEI